MIGTFRLCIIKLNNKFDTAATRYIHLNFEGCVALHATDRFCCTLLLWKTDETKKLLFYHQHSMAISIKSNPVANSCPTHITVSHDMSPKSYTLKHFLLHVVVAQHIFYFSYSLSITKL